MNKDSTLDEETLTAQLKENQDRLVKQTQLIFDAIVDSLDDFPTSLKDLFARMQELLHARFPEMEQQLVGGGFFFPSVSVPRVRFTEKFWPDNRYPYHDLGDGDTHSSNKIWHRTINGHSF